ncbi:MAG: N-acetylmuramoyl-L-alanine amidase [Aquificaceae bacterium]
MFLRILVIFSLILGFGFSQTALVRIGKYPDKERIVLQVDKRVDYKVFTLENPKRVVVDIMEDVSINLPNHLQARIGKHPWGTRIVFEKGFEEVKAFSLQEPFRIVMDIYLQKTQKAEEDLLVEIVDPAFIRILRHMDTAKGQERIINEVRRGVIISQRRVIVIDPGHGGHDPGATGHGEIREKDVVLSIGKRLASLLEEDGRFHVIMTRREDVFIPLYERANIALRNRADLFVSLHADAHPQRLHHARGTTIFAISSEAAQRRRQHIVSNEQYAGLLFGRQDIPTPARVVLADLAMDVTLNESLVFGRHLARVLGKELQREVYFRGIQRAGFAVLKTPGIPSLLVEVGFMTNPEEALVMTNPEFQDLFARALYKAIVDYFFPSSKKTTLNQGVYGPAARP